MPVHSSSACNACYHECENISVVKGCAVQFVFGAKGGLGEAEVLATRGHGGEEGFAEVLVRLVLGKVEFCSCVSNV
jgi:hypothetical protein